MKEFAHLTKYEKEVHFPLCCVYYLFDGSRLMYIGKTINLKSRIQAHRKTKKFTKVLFDEFHSIPDIDAAEEFAINKYLPPLNKRIGTQSSITYLPKLERKQPITIYIKKDVIDAFRGKNNFKEAVYQFALSEYEKIKTVNYIQS